MRLLELFSGTGSVGMPWRENGHEVISVDTDPRFNPEICNDILLIDYTTLPIPDVIWASPDCSQYSRARTRAKAPRSLAVADSLVARTKKIIQKMEESIDPARTKLRQTTQKLGDLKVTKSGFNKGKDLKK